MTKGSNDNKGYSLSWPYWITATLGYGLIIAYGSLVPLNYQPLSLDTALARFRDIRDLQLGIANRADWLANLFLYIPLGFLGTIALGQASKKTIWRIASLLLAATFATTCAFSIEFTQLWFPPRTVSQNDLRAEAIGACLGAILGFLFLTWKSSLFNRLNIAKESLLAKWGSLYLIALLAYSLLPGDFVVTREEFFNKLALGKVTLVPLATLNLNIRELLYRILHITCFLPVGYLIVQKYQIPKQPLRRSIIQSVWGGAALALLIETLQLPIYSRESSTDAIFFGTLGALLGGILCDWASFPEHRHPWLTKLMQAAKSNTFWKTTTLLYIAIIFLVMLAPFRFITDVGQRLIRWDELFSVPFAALYYSTEFSALTNILQKGFVFAILGIIIQPAFKHTTRWALIATILIALLLGAAIEVAQVFVDSHQPDLTDIFIYTAFASLGYFAASAIQEEYKKSHCDSP